LLDVKNADFVMTDKAYDNNAILNNIVQMEAIAVISPKSNRKEQRDFDRHYHKDRHFNVPNGFFNR